MLISSGKCWFKDAIVLPFVLFQVRSCQSYIPLGSVKTEDLGDHRSCSGRCDVNVDHFRALRVMSIVMCINGSAKDILNFAARWRDEIDGFTSTLWQQHRVLPSDIPGGSDPITLFITWYYFHRQRAKVNPLVSRLKKKPIRIGND